GAVGASSGRLSDGGVHFLKAGISCADKITTVSPTYAAEICTPEGGFGLDGLLRVRSDSLSGIVNGADMEAWNPAADANIPFRYSSGDMEGKKRCKAALQREFRLHESEDTPLVAMVTRLAEQKGIAEVFAPMYGCMYRMCTELDVQFAVVGSGERWCEDEIRALQERLPNLRAFIGYNEALSHRTEAGADFFLMPSRYEPCGLNQLYSQLYGAVPIVRATGGLADTVEPFVSESQPGTGFLFDSISPDAVFHAVRQACALYADNRRTYGKMQAAGMRRTFGWSASAARYLSVYESAASGRKPPAD
ncbi:MAG: glycogen/starch synthase, partial [Treponemataceae bacterium]|nr:glycogen/starch synthase [Treponemataceae bacterium]